MTIKPLDEAWTIIQPLLFGKPVSPWPGRPGQAYNSQFALCLLDDIAVQRQNGNMKRRAHAGTDWPGHALCEELKKGIKQSFPENSMKK